MSDARRTIDEITRTLTSLTSTERFAGRDDTGDFKATIQTMVDLVSTEAIPIGTVINYDSAFPSTPALSAAWQDCDGTVIATGIYTGYRTRNLNGASVVLTQTWATDSGGAYTTLTAVNLTAINVGDNVTGTGISNVNGQNAMVIDITGLVVTINDTAATGSISSTFNNAGVYVAGGTGSDYDTVQAHWHEVWRNGGTGSTTAPGLSTGLNTVPENPFATVVAKDAITDTTNGTPRTAARTKPHTRYLKYAIKIS